MSRWIRGIYNAAANFNLSNALRAASLGGLGRNGKQLHTESDKSSEYVEPNQSSKSNQSDQYGGTCHRNRDTVCSNGDHCHVDKCGHRKGPKLHVEGCACSGCRDYNEYISHTASVRTEGQGSSSWIRLSDESGSAKQPDTVAARTNIEHITGIPTGTAI
jgi:hypothetical protein